MTLEDRVTELRQRIQNKIVVLDRMIKDKTLDDWYVKTLRGQRADFRYFVKELDVLMLEHQMDGQVDLEKEYTDD